MPLFYFTKRHSNLSGSGPIFQRDHRDSDIATYSDLTRYKGSPLSTSSNDAPRGIHVNAVSLDPIATPLHTKLGLSEGQLSDTAAAIQAAVPLKRFGEATEIARRQATGPVSELQPWSPTVRTA
ncbi:MAG TPA: hypothetical protein VL424_18420 [Pararobbsia sp.]|jgi:hypothetical protein|nr:hypothetical protein [Pararobbsia sp.]